MYEGLFTSVLQSAALFIAFPVFLSQQQCDREVSFGMLSIRLILRRTDLPTADINSTHSLFSNQIEANKRQESRGLQSVRPGCIQADYQRH